MKKEIELSKYSVTLRPAKAEDSDLILRLRTDNQLSTYLGRVDADLASQISWMKKYLERENEYYYIIQSGTTPVGTISIYNHTVNSNDQMEAEWGRWVIDQRYPIGPISTLCLFEIAFEQLGYDLLYCQTVSSNNSVVSFHDSYATRITNREGTVKIDGQLQPVIFHEISKNRWADVKRKLDSIGKLCFLNFSNRENGGSL